MSRFILTHLLCLLASHGFAQSVVPERTIRAQSVILEKDLAMTPEARAGAFSEMADVVGQEARITLYAGRPIRFDDVGPPAVVDRNQIVFLEYRRAGLRISTEGRALQRGGVGDLIRIMNLQSRATLFGLIQPDGTIRVGK